MRKRTAKPIEIALTEEQIEGIIEEAAARAGRPSAAAASHSWGIASVPHPEGDSPVATGGAGAGAFPSSLAGDAVLGGYAAAGQEYVPLGEASLPPGTVGDPTPAEIRELEEHRRNAIRQIRGRE